MPQRVIGWLWTNRGPAAAGARLPLVPAALAYQGMMRARAAWGALRAHRASTLSIPTVVVGSILAGGAGKTPFAAWTAATLRRLGCRPGIVLRPYGGDEATLHAALNPGIPVVEEAERAVGVRRVAHHGCDVAVLDDAFQRVEMRVDLRIALAPADATGLPRWTHPAGPWRERWEALGRADVLVVTRKRSTPNVSRRLVERLRRRWPAVPVAQAQLRVGSLYRMVDRASVGPELLHGRSVLASAGIADPESLAQACRQLGARTRLLGWPDHHEYRARDIRRLLQIASTVDYVVVTEKDAVKLRRVWPDDAAPPLVAALEVQWESGIELVTTQLARLASQIQA